MTGGGQIRSDWNMSLLEDVLAPAYAVALAEAAQILVLFLILQFYLP